MKLTLRLVFFLSVPPLMWAGNAVVGRMMAGQIPPLTFNLLRWVIAGLILLPLGWRALKDPRSILARWRYLLGLGVLGMGLYNSMQYLALVTSSAINVTLVAASTSAWMLIVGAVFFGVRPDARQWLGAVLGILGASVVIGRGSLQTLLAVHFVPGDLFILIATIGWAFYSWMLARPPASMQGTQRPDWDWAGFLVVQICFGLLACGPVTALEHVIGAPPIPWGPGVMAALAFVAIGPSVLAYRCWGLGVAQGGPALAGMFQNLTPLLAALLSTVLLDDRPHAYHALAFILIVAGIVLGLPRQPATSR